MTRRQLIMMGMLGWIACVALPLGGCASSGGGAQGLPTNAKLIGQGKGFRYVVPTNGRMYIVRHGKVQNVRIALKGETFYAIGPVEGDDPDKNFSELEYYFEPEQYVPVN